MTTWFLCTIQYIKILENDKAKNVSEQYLVDAVSFTDAETRLYRSLSSAIKDFIITRVSKTNYIDVFNYEDCETWYKCKISYLDVDEHSGKEKRVSKYMLIAAPNPREAYDRLQAQLSTWVIPFEITDINLSPILEVIPYVSGEELLENTNLKPIKQIAGATEADYEKAELEAEIEEEIVEEEEIIDDETGEIIEDSTEA
ncbi:MAG: hypothetical protein OHK0057_22800 [Thermoflexibacter sp.]|uniref:DUF4494 domain-containing protein n=1 Tax=Thermoflexibacter ruber TaxID=1003 RepID=A0A1I2AYU7_9BACT|nr:DUF4494 domain-containing protein [Thermoflexibacter ruber]SFE48070.1 protein of unknown function [Thermoflexibacter ruber]